MNTENSLAISLASQSHSKKLSERMVKLKVAAKEIIARLEDAKPLKIPDTINSFVLETDASELAYGAVLKQNDRPIMFISNTFNAKELQYWRYPDLTNIQSIFSVKK